MNKSINIKKLNIRQVIFCVIYLAIAFFIAFLINKGAESNFHSVYNDIEFSDLGGNYVSKPFSAPVSNELLKLDYTINHDTELIISVDGNEVKREPIIGTGEWATISTLYYIPNSTSNLTITFLNSSSEDTTVHTVDILSDQIFNKDGKVKAALAFLVMILGLVLILCYRNNIISIYQMVPISILFIISLFVSSPLMLDYLPYGHDLWCHVGRIEGFKDALIDGQIFPIIIPNAFNGYGILGFEYPELFLYVPGLLRLYGTSMTLAYQVFLFIINIATAYIAYYSVLLVLNHIKTPNDSKVKITGVALVSSLSYLMASYRLSDMYIRAASGETLAMIFLPLIIAGLYHICIGNKKYWWVFAIGLTSIMQSHILSCILIIPLIVFIILPFIKEVFTQKRWLSFIYTLVAFLVLNLWYIIPFIRFYLLPLNSEALLKYKDYVSYNVVRFSRLFTASVGTGFKDGEDFTLSIGITSLIIIILSAIYIYEKTSDKDRWTDSTFRFMFGITGSFIFFLFFSSELVPWDYLEENYSLIEKLVDTMQFPYRFLTLATVCLVFMLAIGLTKSSFTAKHLIPLATLIVGIALYDSSSLISSYVSSGFVSVRTYSGGFTEHLPEDYLPANLDMAILDDRTPYIQDGIISDFSQDGTHITFTYSSDVDTTASIPLLYYPCYKAKDENKNSLTTYQNDDKRIGVILPAGTHTINIKVSL